MLLIYDEEDTWKTWEKLLSQYQEESEGLELSVTYSADMNLAADDEKRCMYSDQIDLKISCD